MLRAGELIRHGLAEVFQRGETNDPALDKLAPTVVEVQISSDLIGHRVCAHFVCWERRCAFRSVEQEPEIYSRAYCTKVGNEIHPGYSVSNRYCIRLR